MEIVICWQGHKSSQILTDDSYECRLNVDRCAAFVASLPVLKDIWFIRLSTELHSVSRCFRSIYLRKSSNIGNETRKPESDSCRFDNVLDCRLTHCVVRCSACVGIMRSSRNNMATPWRHLFPHSKRTQLKRSSHFHRTTYAMGCSTHPAVQKQHLIFSNLFTQTKQWTNNAQTLGTCSFLWHLEHLPQNLWMAWLSLQALHLGRDNQMNPGKTPVIYVAENSIVWLSLSVQLMCHSCDLKNCDLGSSHCNRIDCWVSRDAGWI